MTGWRIKIAIGLWCLLLAGAVQANVIVSNLAGGDGLGFGGTGNFYAQSFTTDDQAYRLDSIVLKVFTSTLHPPVGVSVQIWDDRGYWYSEPRNSIGDFLIPDLPGDVWGEVTFTLATELLLSPVTTYWISATHSTESFPGVFQVKGTYAAGSGPGTLGDNLLVSFDEGDNWGRASDQRMKLQVNGTPVNLVSLPPTWLLLSLGLIALVRHRNGAIPAG